jgi:hypothetical protein
MRPSSTRISPVSSAAERALADEARSTTATAGWESAAAASRAWRVSAGSAGIRSATSSRRRSGTDPPAVTRPPAPAARAISSAKSGLPAALS